MGVGYQYISKEIWVWGYSVFSVCLFTDSDFYYFPQLLESSDIIQKCRDCYFACNFNLNICIEYTDCNWISCLFFLWTIKSIGHLETSTIFEYQGHSHQSHLTPRIMSIHCLVCCGQKLHSIIHQCMLDIDTCICPDAPWYI